MLQIKFIKKYIFILAEFCC